MLGTYVWVYSGDPHFSGEVVESDRSGYRDDEAFIAENSITLSAAKEPDANEPAVVRAQDVSGQINWGRLKVAFEGVRRVREEGSTDPAVPWIESFWQVLLTEDDNDEVWLDMEGNAVGAAAVVDDNGYPFLVFDWSHPPGCHSSWSGYYLGKRLVEKKEWRLTDDERERLGMGKTFRTVEKSAKEVSPGVYSEDEEEEDCSCAGSDDESASDSEVVGEKRKASDDETGTNKRRRQ